MSRTEEFFGAGDPERLFQGHPATTVPFPSAGRRKDRKDYEGDKVQAAITDPQYPVSDIDPRELRATQPTVTRAGVAYYLGHDYEHTGQTFADQHQAGNRVPVVYDRDGDKIILSGHHRATADLLAGRQFRAKLVEGTWGPPRG